MGAGPPTGWDGAWVAARLAPRALVLGISMGKSSKNWLSAWLRVRWAIAGLAPTDPAPRCECASVGPVSGAWAAYLLAASGLRGAGFTVSTSSGKS